MNSPIKAETKFRLTPLSGAMIVVALLLAIYIGAYAVRSREGRYEPVSIDLGGTRWYRWAPAGFVTDSRWDHSQAIFYYPLYLIDLRFWHTAQSASDDLSSKLPVNEKKRE